MKYSAGSLESSDCLITISNSNTLKEHKIEKIDVFCQDKGALDYTIKSRKETAILRRGENNE
jgi:citrate lyase gamma subunit